MPRVVLSRRAERDLRRIGPGSELSRLRGAFERLAADEPNLDIRPISGRTPWLRLRAGDWRVLFRKLGDDRLVARVVHRSELERAVSTLD